MAQRQEAAWPGRQESSARREASAVKVGEGQVPVGPCRPRDGGNTF